MLQNVYAAYQQFLIVTGVRGSNQTMTLLIGLPKLF
jgi:hypothetical protein